MTKLLIDMQKIAAMKDDKLAHKLDINFDSANELKKAVEELIYILKESGEE